MGENPSELDPQMRLFIEQKRQAAIERRKLALEKETQLKKSSVRSNSTDWISLPKEVTSSLKTSITRKQEPTFTASNSIIRPVVAPIFLSGPVKCDLIMERSSMSIDFSYSPSMIELLRSVPGTKWEPDIKKWVCSLENFPLVLSKLSNVKPALSIEHISVKIINAIITVKKGFVKPEPPCSDLLGPKLNSCLHDFQREGIDFVRARNGRAMIADEMGLGKTLQTIALIASYNEWPVIICCPASVRSQWKAEILTWIPHLISSEDICFLDGKQRLDPKAKILLVTYTTLGNKRTELLDRKARFIVLDESHQIKTHTSSRSCSASALCRSISRVVLLTGTPALSRPIELYPQIAAVRPNLFRIHDFGERYCQAKKMPWGGMDLSGAANLSELQSILNSLMMIRRVKADVLRELPPKTRKIIPLDGGVDPSVEQNENRVAVPFKKPRIRFGGKSSSFNSSDDFRPDSEILERFNAASAIKIPFVEKHIAALLTEGDDMVIPSDEKLLIFAHHSGMLDACQETLDRLGVDFVRIDGTTLTKHRGALADLFNNLPTKRVALLSITAAGAGLNLTAANHVVFAELYWCPGILLQAEDRAHRLGQRKPVSISYLTLSGCVDDDLVPLIKKKLSILESVGLKAAHKDMWNASQQNVVEDDNLSDLENICDLSD